MRKKKLFDDKLILEKYLKGRREEDDTLGDIIGSLIRKFSDTRNKEEQLQLVLYIILVILSSEEEE